MRGLEREGEGREDGNKGEKHDTGVLITSFVDMAMGLVWPFGFPFLFNHKTLYPWGTLPQVRNIHTTLVFGGYSSLYWLFPFASFRKRIRETQTIINWATGAGVQKSEGLALKGLGVRR